MPDELEQADAAAPHEGPGITEFYDAYVPPSYFRPVVEDLVAFLPSRHLVGLKTILLTNSAAVTPRQRRQKIFQRGRKHKLVEARGAYYRATPSRQAYVTLFVDNILKAWSPGELRFSFFRRMMIAEILYHEVGHHIHTVHRPVFDGRENVAGNWERKLSQAYLRKHYWYLIPFRRPILLMADILGWVEKKRRGLRANRDAVRAK